MVIWEIRSIDCLPILNLELHYNLKYVLRVSLLAENLVSLSGMLVLKMPLVIRYVIRSKLLHCWPFLLTAGDTCSLLSIPCLFPSAIISSLLLFEIKEICFVVSYVVLLFYKYVNIESHFLLDLATCNINQKRFSSNIIKWIQQWLLSKINLRKQNFIERIHH